MSVQQPSLTQSSEHLQNTSYRHTSLQSDVLPDEYRQPSEVSTGSTVPAAASIKSEKRVADEAKFQYPPLFVGVNLPGERSESEVIYTDEALVQGSLLNEYDMMTSKITTPSYREKIEAMFAANEGMLMSAAAAAVNLHKRNSVSSATASRSLQTRPLRNDKHSTSTFVTSPSFDGSASFRSANSATSPLLDRGSPAPSLFTAPNAFFNPHQQQTPITAPQHQPDPSNSLPFDSFEVPPLDHEDVLLIPGEHIRNVIAITAPWVELDSKNPRIAALSTQVLLREIAYATYCGVTYFIVCGPKRRTNIEQYSQAISKLLDALPPYSHLLIHMPFSEEDYISSRTGERVPPSDYLSIWDLWNTIQLNNNYPPNLSVALQVPPKCTFPPEVLTRWYAEPVRMLILSSVIFVGNAKGFPVLPKVTQSLLFKFFKKSPFLILSDVNNREFEGGSNSYLLYIRHLIKIRPKPSTIDIYSEGHQDVLQLPLQPLADNLESITYEVFERDEVKYAQYEKAILKALQRIQRPEM